LAASILVLAVPLLGTASSASASSASDDSSAGPVVPVVATSPGAVQAVPPAALRAREADQRLKTTANDLRPSSKTVGETQSTPVPFTLGDVFVGMSTGGKILHYNSAGALVDTLSTGHGR
jgi:hypothetical protein